MEPDASLKTNTKSFSQKLKPNLSNLIYSLNGDAVTLHIYGSPGTTEEEINTVELDGASNYPLIWTNVHDTYQILIEMFVVDGSPGPTVSDINLTGNTNATTTLSWSTNDDWINSQSTEGVVYEDTNNTDYNDGRLVQRGYNVANPQPGTPYFYYPMHEDTGNTVYDFGSANNNASFDSGVTQGQEGLFNTSSYEFTTSSYIGVGQFIQTYYEGFESGTLDNWTNTNNFYTNRSPSYKGSSSGGSRGNGSIEATWEPFDGQKEIESFEYKWWETSNQTGHVVILEDENGNEIMESGNENPQWYLNDGNGGRYQVYGGSGYKDWTYFAFEFDWVNGEYDYHLENIPDNVVKTGTEQMDNNSPVDRIRFTGDGYGSADDVVFDDMEIKVIE